jgi:DNA-binding transcriptional LysR family regulator
MTRHARTALAEMDRARDEIAALKSGLTGRTVIGAVLNPGMNLVPMAVASLKQRQPRILVRIEIDNSDALVRRLLKGELDIVVARLLGSHGAGELSFEPLAVETHGVIARAAHPFPRKRRLDLADLADQPWILPPSGSLLRDRLDAMFVQRGLGPLRNVVETASIQVIISLLQNTDMISALQVEAVDPYCKVGLLRVLPLTLGVLMEPFGIVTRRGHPMSPGTEAMLASLREAAAHVYAGTRIVTPVGARAPAAKPQGHTRTVA